MKLIWIPHQHEAWTVAQLLSSDAKSVTVRTKNGSEQTLPGALSTFDLVTIDELETNYNNLVDMEAFNEGIILHQVKQRYQKGAIYTFVGNILIALNPYKRLDLYKVETMHAIRQVARANGVVPPHVFSIGAIALEKMLADGSDQAVLISGESGAGKTETTKLVLQYLSTMAGSTASRGAVSVENQILDSNPLLEGFGNAKTVRNNNSSRFGKYMEVNFNDRNAIKGCNVIAYLLEKTRVVMQMPTERNYHSFYMLVAGAPKEMRQEFALRPAEQFNYLSQSGCVDITGRDDVAEFQELEQAMSNMTMDKNTQKQVFRVLAAILHLGNLSFQPSRDVDGGSQVTSLPDLKKVISMLGLNSQNLAKGLCFKESSFQANETIMMPLDPSKACDQRDALAKHIYGRLFDYIVFRVNNVLFRGKSGRSIGVLDIFGFEVFTKNSFEQLCINYCNERLQTFFNEVIFQSEQNIYLEEGIDCEGITFQDNIACVKLIDGKNPIGIFSMLDEEGVLSRPSDAKFVNRMHATYEESKGTKSEYYSRNRRKPDEFGVKHFAGEVVYNSEGFLEKNKDALSPTLLEELESGSIDFLKEAASEPVVKPPPPPPSKKGGKSGNKLTLSAKFKLDLDSLMTNLKTTNPHFIRCVKPNDRQQAELFDPILALRQLKYAGLFEAIHIRKAGFSVRQPLEQFIKRYKYCCPDVMVKLKKSGETDPGNICKAMLQYLGPRLNIENKPGHPVFWAVGLTRVFLKSMQTKYDLEHARLASRDTVIVLVQKLLRGFLVRSKLGAARREAMEIKRKRREREVKEQALMLIEDRISQEIEEMIRNDLEEQRRIEERRQERLRQERERKLKHWNRCATKIQKIMRGVVSRAKTKIKKANTLLERSLTARSETGLIQAILMTEKLGIRNKDTKETCNAAKALLITVQGESYVRSQLNDAVIARSDELIKDAIQLAEESGMTYLEEYSKAKQSFHKELKRRHILQELNLLLEKCSSIPKLIKYSDKILELVKVATLELNLGGEYFVQDARNRLSRVQTLIQVRDNIRKAVELCSVSMMRAAMLERHKHLKLYGPEFCEDEARAVLKMIQMASHESEISVTIAVAKAVHDVEGSDAGGDENREGNHSEDGDRDQLETVDNNSDNESHAVEKGVKVDDEPEVVGDKKLENANEKLVDVSKNIFDSSKYTRSKKGVDTSKGPPPSQTSTAIGTDVRLPPFVRTQLDLIRNAKSAEDLLIAEEKLRVLVPNEERRKAYMRVFKWIVSFATWKYDVTAGALDGSGFEMDQLYYGALGHTAHEDLARETELYDVHKAPLKRLKTISTSAGASFGLPGQSVAEQMKSRTGPVVSDATRRRICKRTGGSTSELPSSAPAYIPFSQRSSKTDVAASAALKFIKKKGQPDVEDDDNKSKKKSSRTEEGRAEKAIAATMRDYQKFVNKHGISRTTAWKR